LARVFWRDPETFSWAAQPLLLRLLLLLLLLLLALLAP
jgi:hypothetical protein